MAQSNRKTKCIQGDWASQLETLANAVLALQNKIEQQAPLVEDMELSQSVTVGTGETVSRSNPAIQEFRALVRDYSQAMDTSLYHDKREEPQGYNKNSKLHIVGKSKWKQGA